MRKQNLEMSKVKGRSRETVVIKIVHLKFVGTISQRVTVTTSSRVSRSIYNRLEGENVPNPWNHK